MKADEAVEIRNLMDRLRGIYTVPVNDGAGLLNGKDTFTQTFQVSPIQREAADMIERLALRLADAEEESIHRREAAQRGEEPPEFSSGREGK